MYLKNVFYVISAVLSLCDGARILAIVPTPSYSHQLTFKPIWKELSLRGHQITLITTDPIKDPKLVNLTEIDLSDSYKIWNKRLMEMTTSNVFKSIWIMIHSIFEFEEYQLSHPLVQNLIKSNNESFDVLMLEFILPSYMTFAEKFKCPTILLASIDLYSTLAKVIGNPYHMTLNPDAFVTHTETLLNRMITFILNRVINVVFEFYVYPTEQETVKKYFGTGYPPLKDTLYNSSLTFINSDPVFHRIKALLPSVIQIGGGIHRTPSKPLPKELQKILDSAKDGFIYFSLGSNVKSKDLTSETRNVILETFSELPYTILWKFELENLPNKPNNVITSKWFPQQDVLRHPNIKLFITQCGLQSMDEAIYEHVPMIGMPFFVDQIPNTDKMVKRGFGLSIDYKTLAKENFKDTILEVIGNPKYKKRLKELTELALDQPMTGLEKAIWWTEYVIRHKGATHLRSPLLDVPTYQYYLMDVIAVFFIISIATITLSIILVKCIFRLIFKKTKLKVN
ncbi:hypothetical protein FQA39_LY15963 [Lamprigera yunnana]|nr:hypothetical protein FQA39_LY15963 [Lamprigera yunnana]